jgi:SAM-dependent methyltransferase
MIEWMRKHRPEVAAGRIVPVLSTEESVPLADGMADLVVMINVHHELARPDSIYAEAGRMLRGGGQLLVVDWAPVDTPKGPPLAVRISAEDAAAFLDRAGFVEPASHDGLPWHWMVTAVRP